MSNIPVIDLVFVILIVLMIIHGYTKGFISEVFSWATPILAIGSAVFFYRRCSVCIREKFVAMQDVKYLPEIIAFIGLFIIVMIFIRMVEYALKNIIKGAKLDGLNKIVGLLFGIVEGIAIVAIILFVLSVQPFFDTSKIIGDSFFAEILLPFIRIPLNRGRDVINTAHIIHPGIWVPRSFV